MPQRLILIVVVLIFTFNGEIFAQQKNVENFSAKPSDSTHFMHIKPNYLQWVKQSMKENGNGEKGAFSINNAPQQFDLTMKAPVAQDFYSSHLSFFCRKELQIEKATSIPLRFRLGSIQYTDYLEKKPNATWNR